MGSLIPGAALIYERSDGVVYARYRDAPYNQIPRWIIGGDLWSLNLPKTLNNALGIDIVQKITKNNKNNY
jgi:hypothetical protein